MATNLKTAARAAPEARVAMAMGHLSNIEKHGNAEANGVLVVRNVIRELVDAIAALEAALAAPDLRDRGKMVKPKPGAPAGGYPIKPSDIGGLAPADFRPPEGHPDEIVWLRGYEAGVIAMRKDIAAIRRAALEEAARVADEKASFWREYVERERAEEAEGLAEDIRALAEKEPTDGK